MVKKVEVDSESKAKVGGSKKRVVSYTEKVATKKLRHEVNKVNKENKQDAVVTDKSSANGGSNLSKKQNKVTDIRVKCVKKIVAKTNESTSRLGEVRDGKVRAVGKRKTSVAKVALFESDGKNTILVNGIDYSKFFSKSMNRIAVYSPFVLLGIESGYTVEAVVSGGGKTGQADSVKLGLSKCLAILSDEYCKKLRKSSFLTRDARAVEQKKAGLKKARKKEQFSKR